MSSKTTYHWQDVVAATGLKEHILRYRMRHLGIKGTTAISYEDVKRIIGYHTQKYPKPSKAKVDELKLALKNDGYAVKE